MQTKIDKNQTCIAKDSQEESKNFILKPIFDF